MTWCRQATRTAQIDDIGRSFIAVTESKGAIDAPDCGAQILRLDVEMIDAGHLKPVMRAGEPIEDGAGHCNRTIRRTAMGNDMVGVNISVAASGCRSD